MEATATIIFPAHPAVFAIFLGIILVLIGLAIYKYAASLVLGG